MSPDEAATYLCRSAGIGRQARLRIWWLQNRVGSSPISAGKNEVDREKFTSFFIFPQNLIQNRQLPDHIHIRKFSPLCFHNLTALFILPYNPLSSLISGQLQKFREGRRSRSNRDCPDPSLSPPPEAPPNPSRPLPGSEKSYYRKVRADPQRKKHSPPPFPLPQGLPGTVKEAPSLLRGLYTGVTGSSFISSRSCGYWLTT